MKSRSLFVVLVIGVCFCCCYCSSPQHGDGSVLEVNIEGNNVSVCLLEKTKSNTATIPLSSLVEDYTLLQLETLDDAFVNPWFTTVTEKYIGISQSRASYKLFNRSGKFIGDVGKIGQGPGEYALSIYDVFIDDVAELIYLSQINDNKILVYDTSGKFLRNITTLQRFNKPKLFLSEDILTIVQLAFEDEHVMIQQLDINTVEQLKQLNPPKHLLTHSYDDEIFKTRNTQAVDFNVTSSDTLYHYDVKNNKILPVFTMTDDLSDKPWKQYFQLNKDLIMTNITRFGIGGGSLQGSVVTDLKNKISSYVRVVNDYCGNIPILISIINFQNGYFVYNIQPEQLIEDINNRLIESNCTENDRQMLNKTLSTLKENTNNVVFIGKLKSEIDKKLW